jgi:hypothetical protein
VVVLAWQFHHNPILLDFFVESNQLYEDAFALLLPIVAVKYLVNEDREIGVSLNSLATLFDAQQVLEEFVVGVLAAQPDTLKINFGGRQLRIVESAQLE